MSKSLATFINSADPKSSEYGRKLIFHHLSFKPYITKYLAFHFILTENLSPGCQEQELHHDEHSKQAFQQSLEDEKTKSLILQSLHHDGLLVQEDSSRFVNSLIPAGRIFDIPKNKRKILLDQFFLSNKNFYDRHSKSESLKLITDLENPSEIVPVAYWAKYSDKIIAFERIQEYSQYFHQETDLKDPKSLKKYKFGDYPFVRFLFQEEFNYSGLSEQERTPKGLDSESIERKIARFVEKIDKKLRVSKQKEFKKSFLYSGLDIEHFTHKINSLPNFTAKFEIKSNGERVIYLVYQAQNVIDPLDVEYLFRKYGEDLISGKTEIEIELEDQEKLEHIMSFGKEPAEIFELYLDEIKNTEKAKHTQTKD